MRPLAILLAGALMSAPATSGKLEFTEEEAQHCAREGGCEVVTMNFLKSLYRDGYADGRASCLSKT